MKSGATLIANERAAQRVREGYTSEHDDGHDNGDLLQAAAVYMSEASDFELGLSEIPWPWGADSYKPKDPIRNLVRAGALIAAEIDRLQRKQNWKPKPPPKKYRL